MRKTFFLLLLAMSAGFATKAANSDSLKAQLIRDWQRAKTYTKAYLDAMPSDKYNYRPTDSVRSFAEQMLHLAAGNIGLVSNGTGKDRIPTGREKSATAQSRDSVNYYVMASYDYCINAIQAMDASKLEEMVKRGNLNESRLSWIQKGFEHQTHHRGQCTLYIRMLGIKPPNEMLF
jgi:uncharacterized damage-inducible protein DinB